MARTDRDDWFGAAYAAHRRVAFRIARGLLGDDAAAEDVVQDVFLSLWLRPHAYDPERGSLGTYVGLLARSRALDRRRAATADEGAVGRAEAQLRALPEATESSADAAIRRDASRRALAALDRASDEQRHAVLLACLGHSTSEIARDRRLPLGTAKSRIRLGLARARASLEEAA